MTGPGEEETGEVVAELRQRGCLAATTEEAYGWCWRSFAIWCRDAGERALPAREATVVPFLVQHAADWSWSYMKAMTSAIGHAHRALGMASPCGARVRAVLRRARRDKGVASVPLVDAVTIEQLRSMCAAMRGPLVDARCRRAVWLAAALCSASVLGAALPATDADAAGLLAAIEVRERGRELLVTHGRARVLIDKGRDPVAFTVLSLWRSTVVVEPAAIPEPIRGMSLAHTLRRAGRCASTSNERSCGPDELWWLVSNVDPSFPRRMRDVAYLLVSCLLALRHKDLAELDLAAVAENPAGFALEFLRSKADPDGTRPPRPLPHAGCRPLGDPASMCPACALAVHLRVLAATGRTGGPVFATRYRGDLKVMTYRNATLIFRPRGTPPGCPGRFG